MALDIKTRRERPLYSLATPTWLTAMHAVHISQKVVARQLEL